MNLICMNIPSTKLYFSFSQYKTVNTNELKRILVEQRKRIETDAVQKGVSEDFSFLQDYSNKSEDNLSLGE